MKKFIKAIFIVISVIIASVSVTSATETTYCELYSIEVKSNSVILSGRQFIDSDEVITLTAVKQSESPALAVVSSSCLPDGSFELEFEAEFAAYNLNFCVADKSFALYMDFSDYKELFMANVGYKIDGVRFEPEVITLKGTHEAAPYAEVGLTLVDESKTGLDAIKGVAQTKSEGQSFEFKLMAERGSYNLSLEAYGLEKVKANFVIGNISDSIMEKDNVGDLLTKLNDFVGKLALKLSECEDRGIAVDYE